MSIEEFIKNLSQEDLNKIIEEFAKKENSKPSYKYSKIRDIDLKKLVDIEQNLDDNIFDNWLNNNISLNKEVISFLENILRKEKKYLPVYSEENLKMRFLSPIFIHIDFKTDDFRDFYDEKLTYQAESFIFNGSTNFLVSKGIRNAQKPYFFIQEFKRAEDYSNPRPQLLAELISAVELNNWKTIKGAYIIGAIWNFVILEKLDKNKYQYFVSENFDSTKIEDLKGIYKNLLFVKQEIIEMVKRGE